MISTPDYDLSTILICDEIRIEITGKPIIIGVYVGTIVVSTFPAQMSMLCFLLLLRIRNPNLKKFIFQMVDSEGKNVLNVEDNLPTAEGDDQNHILQFQSNSVKFSKENTFVLKFGIEEPPRDIYQFTVRAPQNEEEAARTS
jgi:hypothetical protein